MSQNVLLTNEQFQELLSRLLVQNAPVSPSLQSGNLSKCPSRFSGKKGTDVNAFISVVDIYKDCALVSDENAFRGITILCDGKGKWHQDVKANIFTWDELVMLLRIRFGPKKTAYRVHRELFAEEQDRKRTVDVFVCKCKAIIAQIKPGILTESV
ncbi:activity-regulated cytoskeleton associated protein 1-like [Diabrotica undecimpunctata]|uniref:activity-regulated cytoskeleton associated protein 1-like n=1 Tax=Diabrotica undecimpunctata TaxID=50387 RepID=UPI003B631C25